MYASSMWASMQDTCMHARKRIYYRRAISHSGTVSVESERMHKQVPCLHGMFMVFALDLQECTVHK